MQGTAMAMASKPAAVMRATRSGNTGLVARCAVPKRVTAGRVRCAATSSDDFTSFAQSADALWYKVPEDSVFKWVISDSDRAWLVENGGGAELENMKWTLSIYPQQICTSCGMAANLRDIIETAVEKGAHSREQVFRWLKEGKFGANTPPGTIAKCYKCGEQHERAIIFGWGGTNFGWTTL